jgi:hypothetical protein
MGGVPAAATSKFPGSGASVSRQLFQRSDSLVLIRFKCGNQPGGIRSSDAFTASATQKIPASFSKLRT